MQPPTTAQIHTAVEVLKKLGERLNEHAAYSVMDLPDTQLGDQYAGRIEVRAIEQTTQIQTIAAQLEQWRDELLQQRRHCVSHHL
jgi:Mg2+/Co2+ transporter CorB